MVKYKVPIVHDKDYTETKMVCGTLMPEFNHSRLVEIGAIGKEHLDYFDQGSITFCVYGKQEDTEGDPKKAKLTTRVRGVLCRVFLVVLSVYLSVSSVFFVSVTLSLSLQYCLYLSSCVFSVVCFQIPTSCLYTSLQFYLCLTSYLCMPLQRACV